MLLTYRVRARNTSVESENRIHNDRTAATYGFKGGLVPGITVYAYMTTPIVERFGVAWLERGSMQVKFHQPFYDAEEVIVRAEVDEDDRPLKISLTANDEQGVARATALATISDNDVDWLGFDISDFVDYPLPSEDEKPAATRDAFGEGRPLGSLNETVSLPDTDLLDSLDERLAIYRGSEAVAHPFALLRYSNQILMSNFVLGPWIHVSSDLINCSVVRNNDRVTVRGRVRDCFERKGHEFVVLDVLLLADDRRIVQQVRHTAIYNPRVK